MFFMIHIYMTISRSSIDREHVFITLIFYPECTREVLEAEALYNVGCGVGSPQDS